MQATLDPPNRSRQTLSALGAALLAVFGVHRH
jgi:hypothetical protein